MNEKPRLFIGSSTEAFEIAKTIADHLKEVADPKIWENIFDLGDTTIETLFQELDRSDYAVLIATADDKVISRGTKKNVPRDNVIFEAGLFMGRLGRKRAFVVCDKELKLPSDLSGVTVAIFDSKDSALDISLKRAAKRLVDALTNRATEREVDFFRAYLAFIDPRKVELWHTYTDILTGHYDAIKSELDKLQRHGEWSRLLKLKERLREYFEYSGMYQQGIHFGEAYVEALHKLSRDYEAAWSKVKDIGYMLILSGRYDEGRKAICEVIKNESDWASKVDIESRAKLLFYAYRYLAISYHRDRALRDINEARRCLDSAAEQLDLVHQNSNLYQKLKARFFRNLGHLELEAKQFEQAIQHYRNSLELFEKIRDVEHIGTTHLALARALITQASEATEDPLPHLRKAERMFTRIGWIEGQARVLEQWARHYAGLSEREENLQKAETMLGEAISALDNSEVMFERIQSGRFSGRLDSLREELRRVEIFLDQKHCLTKCSGGLR